MGFIMFPLVIHAFDLILSSLGCITINTRGGIHEFFPAKREHEAFQEDPLVILKRGHNTIFTPL